MLSSSSPFAWQIVPVLLLLLAAQAGGRTNYDEAKVPKYTLPDPLVLADGTKVTDAETWRKKRRPAILRLFEKHVYGKSPGRPEGMTFKMISVDDDAKALGGKAIRRQVRVRFTGKKDAPRWTSSSTCPTADRARRPRSWA